MKTDFTPYLEEILPPILSMATLKPSMGVEGKGEAGLSDVLQELGTGEDGDKKANVMTDEIEEKDSALQMLIVFIEELGGGFAKYIDQVSTILLGLTQFYGSDNIRNTSAGALPSLLKCAKEAAPNAARDKKEIALRKRGGAYFTEPRSLYGLSGWRVYRCPYKDRKGSERIVGPRILEAVSKP